MLQKLSIKLSSDNRTGALDTMCNTPRCYDQKYAHSVPGIHCYVTVSGIKRIYSTVANNCQSNLQCINGSKRSAPGDAPSERRTLNLLYQRDNDSQKGFLWHWQGQMTSWRRLRQRSRTERMSRFGESKHIKLLWASDRLSRIQRLVET